jgi:hypothetical protein
MTALSEFWGTTAAERKLEFPCDSLLAQSDQTLFRAASIAASRAVVFRWLCQLRAAPYSYDWIDNFGKPSPPQLTPGLEDIAVGQSAMRIFDIVAVEKDRHLTLRLKRSLEASRMFSDVGVTYAVFDDGGAEDRCRLVVKLIFKYPRGVYGRVMRVVLPWGDLIMMRKQLLNLKRLAEETATNNTHRATQRY